MRTPDLDSRDISRRAFLRIGAAGAGGLLVGFVLPGCNREDRNEKPPEAAVGHATEQATDTSPGFEPNAFIRIGRAGDVTLIIHKVEMGQGTFTSMPMLVAEELEIDLSKVRLEQAPADNERYSDPLLGGQITGGSTSVRGAWKPLREAGTAVRTLLIDAAADVWSVGAGDCKARDGAVVHSPSGRRIGYGDLAERASRTALPTAVALKPANEFRLIGQRVKRLDSSDKTDGKAVFGIDVKLPDLAIATVAASPVPGGKLKSADDAKALAVPGVHQVLKIENAVAVVGDHMWAARQGLLALAPTWDDGPNASMTTESIARDIANASEGSAAVARNDGDVAAAFKDAQRIDAV